MSQYESRMPNANGVVHYTDEENEIWHLLMTRQKKIVADYACAAFLEGLAKLNMPLDRVPQCSDIDAVLMDYTGWMVSPVPALITVNEFFTLLSEKKFPAATFIRRKKDMDYLKEPDIFHEFFGHCPLLTNQAYADFLAWYGTNALKADEFERRLLARLFWFTIEFGLIKKGKKYKVYGGGILSSKEETVYSVESGIPLRHPLKVIDALRTPYRYDIIQPLYYYIESLDELYQLMEVDLFACVHEAVKAGEFVPEFITC